MCISEEAGVTSVLFHVLTIKQAWHSEQGTLPRNKQWAC